LATANLTNFSEFGLIVAAIGVTSGWIDHQWLIVIAIALALSFTIASVLSSSSQHLYARYRVYWRRFQRENLTPADRLLDTKDATIAIIGMGGVGTGAYDRMCEIHGEKVIGIDIDPVTTRNQRASGRNVLLGDPSDADFWDRVHAQHSLNLVMLALPKLNTNLAVLEQLNVASFDGHIAATARFKDEVEALIAAGAETVFNIYTEAGAGFAAHVVSQQV
jgi:lactate dehydrogenase-like 2-hydroxyacid dehydrogenase